MASFSPVLVLILCLLSFVRAVSITSTANWNITNDPEGSVHLNGLAFQQQALSTFGDYQYVAFYSTSPNGYGHHYVNLGRRRVTPSLSDWQSFAFTDYEQTTLDEHNTISMGISGDGKIHLSFDHHVRLQKLRERRKFAERACRMCLSTTESRTQGSLRRSLHRGHKLLLVAR